MLGEDLTITDGNDGEGGQWMLCRGRARGHERFGSCQQGMSATFTKDYHYLIFGAPGAYNWRGEPGRIAANISKISFDVVFTIDYGAENELKMSF